MIVEGYVAQANMDVAGRCRTLGIQQGALRTSQKVERCSLLKG